MDNNTDNLYETKRFFEIDFLKGIATIFMVIFHFFYLLYFLNVFNTNVRSGVLFAMAKISHTLFIFMVGVNSAISYQKFREKNRELFNENYKSFRNHYIVKTFKRVSFLLLAALSMTVLSYIGFGNLFVKFGIFHFIGVALLLSLPIVANKFLALATSALVLILYLLVNTPRLSALFASKCQTVPFLCFISGIYNLKFSSLDHFSLIPYFGLLTFGMFIGHVLYTDKKRNFIKDPEKFEELNDKKPVKDIALIGKNSFMIYFIHFILFYILIIGFKKLFQSNTSVIE